MTKLEELALSGVRSVDVTVRLRGPAGELSGAGYTPHVINAILSDGKLTYPTCVFKFAEFAGPRLLEVVGYDCEMEGELVHQVDFVDKRGELESFFVGGPEDEILIDIDAKPDTL
jgi:hypothetical protein